MSTTRGPNPLGAYLIVPAVLLLSVAAQHVLKRNGSRFILQLQKKRNCQLIASVAVALSMTLLLLYGSHSRAAWLGFIISAAVWCLLSVSKQIRRILYATTVVGVLLIGVGVYQFRDNSFVQTVILHDNPDTGAAVTSNDAHGQSIINGLRQVSQRPIAGCGPGCAGPASFYNSDGGNLSENYYIQVAQEVGVLGLALFIIFTILIARELYAMRKNSLAVVLLSTLVGLSVANLLLHVWADETIAYVWWGTAGLFLAQQARDKTTYSE